MLQRFFFLVSLVAVFASASRATVIRFDEYPADDYARTTIPADRYADLGIHFNALDNGSTHGGIANGDPGDWGLNGTNGPIFSGFNQGTYGLSTTFDQPIKNFSLDVSRSGGSSAGNTFTLTGLLYGVVVDTKRLFQNHGSH